MLSCSRHAFIISFMPPKFIHFALNVLFKCGDGGTKRQRFRHKAVWSFWLDLVHNKLVGIQLGNKQIMVVLLEIGSNFLKKICPVNE